MPSQISMSSVTSNYCYRLSGRIVVILQSVPTSLVDPAARISSVVESYSFTPLTQAVSVPLLTPLVLRCNESRCAPILLAGPCLEGQSGIERQPGHTQQGPRIVPPPTPVPGCCKVQAVTASATKFQAPAVSPSPRGPSSGTSTAKTEVNSFTGFCQLIAAKTHGPQPQDRRWCSHLDHRRSIGFLCAPSR